MKIIYSKINYFRSFAVYLWHQTSHDSRLTRSCRNASDSSLTNSHVQMQLHERDRSSEAVSRHKTRIAGIVANKSEDAAAGNKRSDNGWRRFEFKRTRARARERLSDLGSSWASINCVLVEFVGETIITTCWAYSRARCASAPLSLTHFLHRYAANGTDGNHRCARARARDSSDGGSYVYSRSDSYLLAVAERRSRARLVGLPSWRGRCLLSFLFTLLGRNESFALHSLLVRTVRFCFFFFLAALHWHHTRFLDSRDRRRSDRLGGSLNGTMEHS